MFEQSFTGVNIALAPALPALAGYCLQSCHLPYQRRSLLRLASCTPLRTSIFRKMDVCVLSYFPLSLFDHCLIGFVFLWRVWQFGTHKSSDVILVFDSQSQGYAALRLMVLVQVSPDVIAAWISAGLLGCFLCLGHGTSEIPSLSPHAQRSLFV